MARPNIYPMNTITTSDLVEEGYRHCEEIAARDKPHLYDAAQGFAHPATRRAFASTYASMRVIDDFVDNIPDRSSLDTATRDTASRQVADWMESIKAAHAGRPGATPASHALTDTFAKFDLPLQPWENLAGAMQSDLSTAFFRDWDHLRGYMDGASVAPAVVFMHLVLMKPEEPGGRFISPWPYEEVHGVTVDLAIFCYWVHILRDVAIDLSLGNKGLVYLPLTDLAEHGLSPDDLYAMKETGAATTAYRQLAKMEAARAREHLSRGLAHVPRILSVVPASNGRALQALIAAYISVLQGLTDSDFDVFRAA